MSICVNPIEFSDFMELSAYGVYFFYLYRIRTLHVDISSVIGRCGEKSEGPLKDTDLFSG